MKNNANSNSNSNNSPEKEMWIIDTDPGCDDMMCLLYMLNRKDIDIKMISLVEGNTSMRNVKINIRKILKLTGREEIPVYEGCEVLMKGSNSAAHVHGDDGLGNMEELISMPYEHIPLGQGNSALKMLELFEQYPGKINLLMVGPLTNLAIAYMLNPDLPNLIKTFYTMGGAINSRGNISPTGEFNYTYDFVSTSIVLPNFKNTVLIPWEPIERHIFKHHDFLYVRNNILSSTKKFHEHTCSITEKMFENFEKRRGGFMICDLYAAIAIFNSSVVKNCFIAKCVSTLDSEGLKGGLNILSKRKVNSYEEGLDILRKIDQPGYQLVVDILDRETIVVELHNIYYA